MPENINKLKRKEIIMNQRLDCYRLLVDVAKAMPCLIKQIPRGEGYLIDHLKRALSSSILNLAEGNGRYSTKERNRFFNYSLGSIKEVMASIELLSVWDHVNHELSQALLSDLRHAYSMIRKLKK